MIARILQEDGDVVVSMKSGLEGRNNRGIYTAEGDIKVIVSMKSGLEGRNNVAKFVHHTVTDDESQ